MLLRVREACREGELRVMMEEFLPFHEASQKVWSQLEDLLSGNNQREECRGILEATTREKYVPARMRSILVKNVLGLFGVKVET